MATKKAKAKLKAKLVKKKKLKAKVVKQVTSIKKTQDTIKKVDNPGGIGCLGDIVFSVSRKTIRTFDDLSWESSERYATHDRYLKKPLLEFTGNNLDTITFNMKFSAYLGVNPMSEIEKVSKYEKQGKACRLIIGGKTYGSYKWVITKTSKTMNIYDNKGNLISAKISVSLTEYAKR